MAVLTCNWRKIRTIFAGVAITIAIAGCTTEPKHNGKTLSSWLDVYDKASEGSPEEQQVRAALGAMGTNAVSCLTKWIAQAEFDKQYAAAEAFRMLGTDGSSAVPALAVMLTSTNELVATLASTALGYIGEPALPALLEGFTNRSYRVGTYAALALAELGTNARPAVPLLVRAFRTRTRGIVRERRKPSPNCILNQTSSYLRWRRSWRTGINLRATGPCPGWWNSKPLPVPLCQR